MINNFVTYTQIYLAYKLKKTKLDYLPVQVSVEPTNMCNFKCNFCNQSDPNHFIIRQSGRIDSRDYEVILERIKKECNNVKLISLTLDGEPTLHKDLPAMIKKANQKGFFIRFSSNGHRIDHTFLEKTKDLSYLISIDFSLDKDGFEKTRGYNGSWSIINNNLKEIVHYLHVNKNLYLEIFENSAYYNESDKAVANLSLLKKYFGKMPRLTYGLRTYHKIIDGHTQVSCNGKYYGCLYPWTSLNIAWNGDIVTCCRDLDGKYILGNVLQSSIERIWNGGKYLHLREAILKKDLEPIPPCKSCDLPYDSKRNSLYYKIQKVYRKW